jgi:hypothetical protein
MTTVRLASAAIPLSLVLSGCIGIGTGRSTPETSTEEYKPSHMTSVDGAAPGDVEAFTIALAASNPDDCEEATVSANITYRGYAVEEDAPIVEGMFEWRVDPAEATLDQVNYHLRSPYSRSLAAFGKPVVVTAAVVGFPAVTAQASYTFPTTCPQTLGHVADAWGKMGESGSDARGRIEATEGGRGDDGDFGRTIVAEAAWVTTPSGERRMLVVAEVEGEPRLALVDPSPASKVAVTASGGQGGSGGSGGEGSCYHDGGPGGPGGTGGDAGSLTIRVSDAALFDYLELFADGGQGGVGGSGGRVVEDCGTSRGASGDDGTPGASGTITKKVVPAAKLELIRAAVAAAPGYHL